eukprot:14174266-Heterocapsa_arctica.AAC.1
MPTLLSTSRISNILCLAVQRGVVSGKVLKCLAHSAPAGFDLADGVDDRDGDDLLAALLELVRSRLLSCAASHTYWPMFS